MQCAVAKRARTGGCLIRVTTLPPLLTRLEALTHFIRDFLRAGCGLPCSEYTLIQALEKAGLFDNLGNLNSGDRNLLLFQKHFLCMHVLYTLQQDFYQQQQYLHISPLTIYLQQADTETPSVIPAKADSEVRAYYLDLDTLLNATSETVADLQRNFLEKYQAWLQADDAYAALQLQSDACWRDIQNQYRRLIHQAHPDKGGDRINFERIQAAYETLKQRHRN